VRTAFEFPASLKAERLSQEVSVEKAVSSRYD
jgi:hypothetical protein